jgi:hypothetical protein
MKINMDMGMEMEMGMEAEPEGQQPQRQRQVRPTIDRSPITQTAFDRMGPRSIPEKPKILVLGASGRNGRHVVRQLLDMKLDMTVVAFVRDYDKAIRVLYDDILLVPGGSGANNNQMNPKLQIVEGNLIPPEELPGFVQDDTEDERVWKENAESASSFYKTKVEDYDNRELIPDVNESLEEAIRDCTTIISCVGSIRTTHLWHDILARPVVRLLKADVSSWCKDGSHPYYVHYVSTRKVLGYAEREQVRREAAAITVAEAEGLDVNEIHVPRIRFIRISDLSVVYKPWDIVPVIANAVHSLVFRYQEMAERILEESTMVETVILRPGDLVDEERDINTTSVQVDSSGRVPSPALMGREDVATLAVAAATFMTQNKTDDSNTNDSSGADGTSRTNEPFHYTFGCRWVGQTLDSYPPQGHKRDGHTDSALAFRRSLKTIHRNERETERRNERRKNKNLRRAGDDDKSSSLVLPSSTSSSSDMIVRMAEKLEKRRRRPKPYGICVAVPVYLFLILLGKMVLVPSLQYIPGGKEWIIPSMNCIHTWINMGFSLLLRQFLLIWPWMNRRKLAYIRF